MGEERRIKIEGSRTADRRETKDNELGTFSDFTPPDERLRANVATNYRYALCSRLRGAGARRIYRPDHLVQIRPLFRVAGDSRDMSDFDSESCATDRVS
jgi:hypothetical protein